MAELNEKAFHQIGRAVKTGGVASDSIFGRMVKRLTPAGTAESLDWADDADWARLQQEPLRARALLRLAVLFLLLLVLWAAYAELDEVTRGDGKVVPTSQVQVIQSVDGGIVEELPVREGQVVEAGQLLLRVDSTRFMSTMLESRASLLALQAKALRLQALTQGGSFIPPPELLRDAPDIVAQEMRLYRSRREEISAQVSISQNQLMQRQQELNEVRARKEQAERGLELMLKELNATKPMVATGAVSEVEVLRLDREVARLRGDREQADAQISRVQAAIQEATRRIEEVQLTARNQMSAELSETMSKLSSMSEGGRALADKVKHADIRSPVRGTVKRLLVNTVGGVVQPGKEVVEIVPSDDALILEAQVSPRDIAFLHPGQEAMVKFTAYDFSIYGGLVADVVNISADSVVDEKGNANYLVRVRTRKASLGPNLPIIPGMVAQVDILTGKKTVLAYLLKPVLRAKANALSER
ncbi:HlyD family type I secretion periplasmic adaptor subunit [Acidovorax sp.]|jgi:adhesin transport system membrane fusion protein|uniref:HlyD family type I secretion periplasmic adaptor subunit n=1 Tax=Acidovorax sp. TaxID=1872122 RepID=UPI0025C5CE8E|nr:HlyD family type I secretion periplasmic adaptor subunit [Acidovorax sp.]MBL7089348.1 HlyD family type I secretion periplasmic adaptor subunit [Acidovorax sp.]